MEDEKNYCTIYLARHGLTKANVERVVAGHFDSPLIEEGIEQAKNLGHALKDVNFDVVFSSDSSRALHTAKFALLGRSLAIQTLELLREKHMGSFEGKSYDAYATAIDNVLGQMKSVSQSERIKLKVSSEEESEEEVIARFILVLRSIAAAHIGKKVFIVSHGAAMRCLLMHLGFGSRKELKGAIKNTAYIKLRCDGVDFFIDETVGITKNII